MRYTQLANEIRKVLREKNITGVVVEEESGWTTRGSATFSPRGVVNHHTATSTRTSKAAAIRLIRDGRPDVPGPLAQVHISRVLGGLVYVTVIAAGRANHAGQGGHWGITGNTLVWGIEADNNGIGEHWPALQLDAIAAVDLAMLRLSGGVDASRSIDHKEWTRRKIDRGNIISEVERTRLRNLIKKPSGISPEKFIGELDMLIFFRPKIGVGTDKGKDGIYVASTSTMTSLWVSSPSMLQHFQDTLTKHGEKWTDVGEVGTDWFTVFPFKPGILP